MSLLRENLPCYGGHLRSHTGISFTDDSKIIDGTYEQFAPYRAAALAVRREPIQGQLMYLDEKDFPRLKEAKPADFFDNSFADALKSSGFLQSLGLTK